MSDMTTRLQTMLDAGQDNLLLRFTLGKAMLEQEQFEKAVTHLTAALSFDERFSNAWKFLGRARLALGDAAGARLAWEQGSRVATERGDVQVAREIAVFLKRLDKQEGLPSAR